jgi:hypothetical protein
MRLLRPLLVLAGVLLMAGCQTSLVAPNSGLSDLLLSIKPTTLNFGNTTVGNTAVLNVSITNDGTRTVTVAQEVIAGGSAFSTTGIGTGVVLNPHQTATLGVEFRPATSGSASGSVTLTSSRSGGSDGAGGRGAASGAVTITLSGQGVAPGHAVTLTWAAEAGVLGYNVYRRSSGSDPWNKLNGTLVTGNTYTDSTVQSGQLYSYAVSAMGSDGSESELSEIVTVLIPSP